MSIPSVGGSFSYIDPNTVAGVAQSAPASASDDDSNSASATNTPDVSTSGKNPTPPPPQPISAGGPKFAPDTGSALVSMQEKANAS